MTGIRTSDASSIASRGSSVLAAWWPRLLPGAAAGATHGLIRTAHAVRNLESADPDPLLVDELGAGLAYWAARYQPLPGNPSLNGRLTLAEAMARLPRLDRTVASDGPGARRQAAVVVRARRAAGGTRRLGAGNPR